MNFHQRTPLEDFEKIPKCKESRIGSLKIRAETSGKLKKVRLKKNNGNLNVFIIILQVT